jgi:hypothetical protein
MARVDGTRSGAASTTDSTRSPALAAYRRSARLCAWLACALAFVASAAFAADGYSIEHHVVAGGGGTSAGGGHVLSGTIGQAAVGDSVGGTQRVSSGFWQPQPATPVGDAIFRDGFEVR